MQSLACPPFVCRNAESVIRETQSSQRDSMEAEIPGVLRQALRAGANLRPRAANARQVGQWDAHRSSAPAEMIAFFIHDIKRIRVCCEHRLTVPLGAHEGNHGGARRAPSDRSRPASWPAPG